MKRQSFLDFVIKNRYVIICVTIVLVVAALGWIPILIEIAATVGLVVFAIYVGKRIQEDESFITRTIQSRTKDISKEKEDEK